MQNPLLGVRVLIVEDEMLIVMLMEDMLADLGATAVAHASNVAEGLVLAERDDFDVAILDLNLDGSKVFPVAEVLKVKGAPFVFASGYGAGGVPPEFAEYPVIAKPYQIEQLSAGLEKALSIRKARCKSSHS